MINSFRLSENGVAILQKLEGCSLEAYQDSGDTWTIGYGHTGDDVTPSRKITLDEAQMILINDLVRFQNCINTFVKCKLNQQMFDALVIFVYNIGTYAFLKSSMLKKLNVNDYIGASQQFSLWNKVGGKPIRGLTTRRTQEKNLFLKGLKELKESDV